MQWIIDKVPTTISEYYGSAYQLAENFIVAHFSGKPLSDIMILYGPPGVGKSSLINVLLHKHKVKCFYSNASDSRGKEFMEEVVKQLVTDNDYKIVILDEADNIPKISAQVLIKHRNQFKHPLILICNDYYEVHQQLKQDAWEIKFTSPSKKDLLYFLEKFIENNNIKIPKDIQSQIVNNSHSFRGIVSNTQIYYETGMLLEEQEPILDIFDKIRKANKGIETDMSIEDLFIWTASNTKQQNLIALTNVLLMQSRTKTSVREVAKRILQYCAIPDGKLKFFYMGNGTSTKKAEKIPKSKKIVTEKKIIKKEPIKSASVSDWI